MQVLDTENRSNDHTLWLEQKLSYQLRVVTSMTAYVPKKRPLSLTARWAPSETGGGRAASKVGWHPQRAQRVAYDTSTAPVSTPSSNPKWKGRRNDGGRFITKGIYSARKVRSCHRKRVADVC